MNLFQKKKNDNNNDNDTCENGLVPFLITTNIGIIEFNKLKYVEELKLDNNI